MPKLTDEQIIQDLNNCIIGECGLCSHDEETACKENLNQEILCYINSLKAEISVKNKLLDKAEETIVKAKTKAYKEFVERLKLFLLLNKPGEMSVLAFEDIDYLLKEMVGEG